MITRVSGAAWWVLQQCQRCTPGRERGALAVQMQQCRLLTCKQLDDQQINQYDL
jgi:hypothetical protein